MTKLSELSNDTIVSYEDACYTLTAVELRERVENGDEYTGRKWYVMVPQQWKPNAKTMVEQYIENEYNDGMYEGWDDRAFDCLKPEHYERIQAILNVAFKGDHATKYWMLDGPEIEFDTL